MMSGLSLSAIQGYEQGRYEPKRKSLESIAEVFKIPVDELYDMPAELGTNLAEVGTDLISRKQAIDALCAVCGKACDKSKFVYNAPQDEQVILCPEHYCLCTLPSAQSETAKRIVGKSRGGMTLWYQCDMCNEPVDVQDNFCRGCGRRLIDE